MTEKRKRKFVKNLVAIVVILLIIGMNNKTSGQIKLPDTNANKQTESTKFQKVLYVASYSIKDDWSFRIKSGIESVFESRKNLQLKVISMNTMGMMSADTDKKKKAALEVKLLIDSWKPDIVIASDDNASKYLIVPYFKDSEIPFVFCGVNWDASKYGFPSKNVTGMIEVQLVDQLVEYLSPYAKGHKIGSIRGDTMTNRIEAEHFEKQVGAKIKTYFVDNITEWKKLFVQIQNEVNMILIGDIDAVKLNEESKNDVENFMLENTKIPTGRWDAHYKNDALITLATIPEEQGEYAAHAALEILDGKSPINIPIAKNKKAKIFLNMKLAKKLGIIFPMNLIGSAQLIPAD
ncbi:MAG: hypothetical protein HQK75_01865 [Candidatus Magnetomorum sp.]|nr:hypothetical protein [Candidatus Magnetomorum sp.]